MKEYNPLKIKNAMKTAVSLKKILHLLIFSIWIMLTTACSQEKRIEITDFKNYSIHDNPKFLDGKGCIDYDSVVFSDGSYAVKQLKFAPENRLTRYIDSNGRLIATISAASETYAQRLVYGYDENGRLKYLLRFDNKLEEDFFNYTTENEYLHFRLAIDSIDFSNPNLKRHTLSKIIYGNDGTAREIIELPGGRSIKAPDNYRLDVSVVPCDDFWESDLNGGRFLLKANLVPINPTGDYTVKCFEDFALITEDHYKDGVLQPSPQFKEE